MTKDEALNHLNEIAEGYRSSVNWAPDPATAAIIDACEAVKLSALIVALSTGEVQP